MSEVSSQNSSNAALQPAAAYRDHGSLIVHSPSQSVTLSVVSYQAALASAPQPLIQSNRGNELSLLDVESLMQQVQLPLESAALLLMIMIWLAMLKYRVHVKFPSSLFRVIVLNDAAHALLHVLQWAFNRFETLPASATSAARYYFVPLDGRCYSVLLFDNWLQAGSLYLNSSIIAILYFMIVFNQRFTIMQYRTMERAVLCGFVLLPLCVILPQFASSDPPTTSLGWCTSNVVGATLKTIMFILLLLFQIFMIVPTALTIYKSDRQTVGLPSRGFFLYLLFICTELLSLGPLLILEFFTVVQLQSPASIMRWYAIGFPLSRFLKTISFSAAIWKKRARSTRKRYISPNHKQKY